VLADGDAPSRPALDAAWPGWGDEVAIVIAADGGLRIAESLGLEVDRWVGDGDSVRPGDLDRLRRSDVPVDLAPRDKDESDAELALLAAIDAGADDVTILGAIGGPRLDHTLANVALLAHPRLERRPARLLDPRARVTLIVGPGRATLAGRIGDLVSLLPFDGRVDGVATEGLRYPLRDEPLVAGPPRGLSNVRLAETASVRVRTGRLLIVETPANLGS
jgi:thiamine pyrophosphokinase